MAHRRLCKASSILSILILLFVSISVVSCDIQFTRGTAIQEVFEDQLVNDDVSLHPTESSTVKIRLVPDTSVPETIETYIVKFYRNDEEVKSVEVPPIGPLSFVLTDLPRASYIIEVKALTHEGREVAVGEASIHVTSNGEKATIDLTTPVHVHVLVRVDAQDASCTEAGLKEHWYCSLCGKYFADANAEKETSLEELAIPAKGHVDSEYFHNENEHWKVCLRCNKEYDRQSHVFTDWIKGEDGIWRRHCEKCLIEETNNHIAHTMEHHPYKAPKCEENGNKEYWECSVCRKFFSDAECTTPIDKAITVLGKLGHDFSVVWSTDGTHHWHACSRCDAKDSFEEHDFGIVYSFNAAERDLSIRSFCIVCGSEEASSGQPSQTGAFDISTAFGIDVKRMSFKSWRISLNDSYKSLYTGCTCTWTSNEGEVLLEGFNPFTMSINANASGNGRYMVLCHLYDENGNEKEICFVQISSNSK